MSKWAKPDHKRIARVLGYVLTSGTASAWRGFATIAMARLSVEERACLAKAALISLPDDIAELVADDSQGGPLPAFLSLMEDARFWASKATRREKKAHVLAGFEAMAASDQADFIKHIMNRKAVAT